MQAQEEGRKRTGKGGCGWWRKPPHGVGSGRNEAFVGCRSRHCRGGESKAAAAEAEGEDGAGAEAAGGVGGVVGSGSG